MHPVQQLINQQSGFYKWKTFDNFTARLRCDATNNFYNISLVDPYDQENIPDSPVFTSKFAQKKGSRHILALANEDGFTATINTKTLERSYFRTHFNAIFDLEWLCNEMKFITVSGDHSSKLIDVENGGFQTVRRFVGHTRSVKSISLKYRDDSVFATGSRDGSIFIWDIRSSLCEQFVCSPDKIIGLAHYFPPAGTPSYRKVKDPQLTGVHSITGLIYQDETTLFSSSAGDGLIKVWDLRKTYKISKREPIPKYMIPYPGKIGKCGYSDLIVDHENGKLYAHCLDSTIYCYNMLTCNPTPVKAYTGHQNNKSFYVKIAISSDGNYLVSGSTDQNAYIWNTHSSHPIAQLTGHTEEVTCVAWSDEQDLVLVSSSDDMTHKIWRVGPEELPENWNIIGRGIAEVPIPNLKRLSESKQLVRSCKKLKICPNCKSDEKFCENCSSSGVSVKRTIPSENANLFKKLKISNSICDNDLAIPLDDDLKVSPKRIKLDAGQPSTSNFKSQTPKTTVIHSESPPFSPTMNLPNFLVDGSAPYLYRSPKKKANQDWLTTYRKERQYSLPRGELRRPAEEMRSPRTPKLAKAEESPGTRSGKKQRKQNRNNNNAQDSPLLKFFRETNSSIMRDSRCASKASLIVEKLKEKSPNP